MKRWILGAVALLMAGTATAGMKVGEKMVEGASLADYETYAWVSNQTAESGSFLAEGASTAKWMESLGDRILVTRGFRPVPHDDAALHLRYSALSSGSLQVAEGRTEHAQTYWLIDPRTSSSIYYREGALVVEALDAESGELVWAGWASNAVSADERKLTKVVEKAITRILRQIPKS